MQRLDRQTRLTPEENRSRTFILKTGPHPTSGGAYVIVTDHRDDEYEQSLQRLVQHRAGKVIRVDDLGQLSRDPRARERLRTELQAAEPRFVAIAPQISSYRENMLLGMWEVLASLDSDPELDAFPGVLVAPNPAAFAALIERSIHYQPRANSDIRPFVIGQVTDESSIMGLRSLQKVDIIREQFERSGHPTSSLLVRTFQKRPQEQELPGVGGRWSVSTPGPRQFLLDLPEPARRAMEESSLLMLFGHGVPGMTCSLDVKAFHGVAMADKIVLCGSCFSAAPVESDFPAMQRAQDGSEVRNERERFIMRAIEDGAVVAYGHMRENGGFPQLYPVLEAWLGGLTVGEGHQRLMNAIIGLNGFSSGDFILGAGADSQRGAARRNPLLYVVVGDPALVPFVAAP